ncbi:hypothetical protein SAMN05421823_12119 [Catalinimonas alkaloidigena]|uniref:N-acetyltransferase domain-containing protein n=1 Tax=Catalinimonas alkaloidigena TaxID=1075417 RepID=A0A1G9VKG7_9BACT|nr:hypothetical protein [Catalinimonas alkaloidigena]SDM72563.1 hypothetical protein SAMN05421823_12119 [Catalinimonas alkaloidigena]
MPAQPSPRLRQAIRNTRTGEVFDALVLPVTAADLRTTTAWLFDWKQAQQEAMLYKLVTPGNEKILHGLIGLQDRGDHLYVTLVENAPAHRGRHKVYQGVAISLFAFACYRSEQLGYAGFVSFTAKTRLVEHYHRLLGAEVLHGQLMVIDEKAANTLINSYF